MNPSESLSADSPFSKEPTNALNPRFFRDFTRIDHRNHPYADADSSFRISGFTSEFHFQMAKMGGQTTSSIKKEINIPPTSGAAMRLITSAPLPTDHRIGSRAN